jgi:hypothetical protein
MADTIDANGVPLVNTQTNQVESVPFDDAQAALTAGSHNLQSGQQVHVINPDGELVTLPAEEIPDAVQSGGYKLAGSSDINEYNNQKTYGEGPANELKAAAAAAARTATFGGSDVALTKSGLVAPNTLEQLRERNPVSDVAGSLAGAAIPLALPGVGETYAMEEAAAAARAAGLSEEGVAAAAKQAAQQFRAGDLLNPVQAANKVGGLVTDATAPVAQRIASSMANPETSPIVAKILARVGDVGAKTLGSAVEASAYGLGNAVSEHILGDADLNGENILHNVGYAALFGGALGATLDIGEGLYKGAFAKEARQAAAKDAIIENAANHPENPEYANTPGVPNSVSAIQDAIKNARQLGISDELPTKARLLETNDILAGESQYPAHALQIESLSSGEALDRLKGAMEDPNNEVGQILRTYQDIQKNEGTQVILPKLVKDIAPDYKATSDAVEGGNHAAELLTKQWKDENTALKPLFKQFDNAAIEALDQPHDLLNVIDRQIPGAAKHITQNEQGLRQIAKYEPTMSFSKDAHGAISDILEAFNKPEVSIGEIRNLREALRDKINFLSSPRSSSEVSGLRKGLMDIIQDRVQQITPDMDVRDLFRRYAINEENRATIEQVLGGSIKDVKKFAHEIKPEEVGERIFGNTVYVKAMKDLVGDDKFKEILADYISKRIADNTDVATNGFSSRKFANFLKKEGGGKGHELDEAFSDPTILTKLRAATDKMKILPDAPKLNPSGTAKATALQKISAIRGMLTPHGLMEIPGKVLGALGEKFQGYKQREYFDSILRGKANVNSEEQLAQKQKMYGAYSKIERMGLATTRAISRGANALFKNADEFTGVVAQKLIPKEEQAKKYDKLSDHLIEMTNNPQKFAETLQKSLAPLSDIAPSIAGSLSNTATQATQFLRSKMPVLGQPSPFTEAYKPSQSEIARFNRYVQTVENPLKVMDQLRRGDLTKESMETLQAVYPKLLAQMQNSIMEKMSDKTIAKMPYQQKLLVSAFLGTDMTTSLKQQNIASAQIAGSPPPNSPASWPRNKAGPSQKGLGKLERSQASLTPQQASQQRGE